MVERTSPRQQNGHGHLEAEPVLPLLLVVDEVEVRQLVVAFGAAEADALVVTLVRPELRREVQVDGSLENFELLLSEVEVEGLRERRVEHVEEYEGPLLQERVLQLWVDVVDKLQELIAVLLLQGVTREVLRDEPGVADAVEPDQVHAVGMAPYVGVSQGQVVLGDLTTTRFIVFFPDLVESLRVALELVPHGSRSVGEGDENE
mmetsp:Transcript_41110/g.62470  ORF Transcript_41110/g.62470 Transcript_41110/m.62470 type:complete len:204 (-) Transcript_41110:2767-3378(-)